MGELNVKEKEIVIPGQNLATGMDYIPGIGTRREKDEILASQLGMVNITGKVLKLVPLSGVYMPKRNDIVIGQVMDLTYSGWRVSIDCAYEANLSAADATSEFIKKGADLTRYFAIGDVLVGKIFNVTSQNLIDLTLRGPGLRKLEDGRIIKVNPFKVPRIIGKGGSMVSMIKEATQCRIVVGQNGLIWISGEADQEIRAIETIRTIERLAHISGLTDMISQQLGVKNDQQFGVKNEQQ